MHSSGRETNKPVAPVSTPTAAQASTPALTPELSNLPADADHGLEQAMGRMLQIGVTVAAVVVLAGGVLYLAQSSSVRPDYTHFHPSPAGPHIVAGIWADARRLDPRGIIELGILLLIATPIGRVVFGIVGFARLRDRLYTAVSALVLAILLLSFFMQH